MSNLDKYYEAYNFPSLDKFYNLLKKDGVSINKSDVKLFLDSLESEQLMKQQVFDKSSLGAITAMGVNKEWQIDLFFLPKYWRQNKGFKIMFAAIDIFSRKAWIVPMKTKEIDDCTKALQSIFTKYKVKPSTISSDNDSSFLGGQFQTLLNKNNIYHITNIKNDHYSLGIVDRFARTIKTIMSKRFLYAKNNVWYNIIDKIVDTYNNTPNRGILDFTPNNVCDNNYVKSIITTLNSYKNKKNNLVSDVNIYDKVRIRISKLFQKGTEPVFGDEVYTVIKVSGKSITLNDNTIHKRNNLLLVPKDTVSSKTNVIKEATKVNKQERLLKKEGLEKKNIISNEPRYNLRKRN